MNRPLLESGNVAGINSMEMSLLEKQRLVLKQQQELVLQLYPQLQHQSCLSESLLPFSSNPGVEDSRVDFGLSTSGVTVEHEGSGIDSVGQVESCGYGVMNYTPNLRKRKEEMSLDLKEEADNEDSNSKKRCVEEESKISEQNCKHKENNNVNNNDKKNREAASGTKSIDNTKTVDVPKPDFIHVRARRGQATDSHSLAERVRREKISERMKYLQDLVPGCNKITGKAGMLDEIISYVQSLQRQVEFLSMKLAAVNPTLESNLDDLIAREVFAACSTSMPTMNVCTNMNHPNFLQYNLIQQMDPFLGSGNINPVDMGLQRTINTPASVSNSFVDQSYFNKIPSSLPWHTDLQNIYSIEIQQGRSTSFPLQNYTGIIEPSNLKIEM